MRTRLSTLVLIATVLTVTGCGGGSSSTGSSTASATGTGSTSTATTGASSTSPSTTAATGKALSAPRLVAQADAICGKLNQELAAAKDEYGTQAQAARVAAQRAGVEQTALNELSKLTPPTAIADDWQQMIADRRALIEDLNKASADATAKDLKAENAVLLVGTGLGPKMLAAADRGGFKGCGHVG